MEANLVTAFLFGMLSFVSPCVLPLLPGYLSLMSGYSLADLEGGRTATPRLLAAATLFVAGFTAVFLVLGASASQLGSLVSQNRQSISRWAGLVVIAMGLLVVLSAISRHRWLLPLQRAWTVDVRPSRLGGWAAPAMGAAFAFGWTPCIGPILGSILTLAADEATVGRGMALLLAYSLGLGLPFLAASLATARLLSSVGRLRRHTRTIMAASGLMLAGFGVLMITGRVVDLSRFFSDLLSRVGLDRLTRI